MAQVSTEMTMAEWFEMTFGPFRRLLLRTTDRKIENAVETVVLRIQCRNANKEMHGLRQEYTDDAYKGWGRRVCRVPACGRGAGGARAGAHLGGHRTSEH